MPALEALGYELRVREPSWHQHRCLQLASPRVNLHVFGPDCPEAIRHRMFRDWLRGSAEDRQRYAQAKQGAASDTQDMTQYNQRKRRHSARHLRPRVPRGRLHRLNARPSRQEPCMSTQSAAAAPGRRSRPRSIRRAGSAASFSLVVGDGASAQARANRRAPARRKKMGPCTWSLPDGGAPWRMGSRTADAAAGAAGVVTCADYERAVPARWALSFRRALGAGFRCLAQHRTLACCVRREGVFRVRLGKSPGLGFLIHCMNSLHRRNSSICRGRESVRVDVNMRHNVM